MQKQKQSKQQFRDETVLALPQAMPAHSNLTMDPGGVLQEELRPPRVVTTG